MRFGKASNQVRFPAAILDIALPMANAIAVSQVTAQLERELAILGETEDLLARVRATLINRNGQYPGLEDVAQKLHMSPRQMRSEEQTSELQSLMRISYAVICLKHKNKMTKTSGD